MLFGSIGSAPAALQMSNFMQMPEALRMKDNWVLSIEKWLLKKLPKGKRVFVRLRSHGM
jgi:hypothetical protein